MRKILFILILLAITVGLGPLPGHATDDETLADKADMQGGTIIELTEDTVWSSAMTFSGSITIRGVNPDIRPYYDYIRFKSGPNAGDIAIIENLTLIPSGSLNPAGADLDFILRDVVVRDGTTSGPMVYLSSRNSNVLIENTMFINNTAQSLIYVNPGDLSITIRDTAIVNNSSEVGIFELPATNINTLVENTTISGNTSTNDSPLLNFAGTLNVTMRHTSIVEPSQRLISDSPTATVNLEGSILIGNEDDPCVLTGQYTANNTLSNLSNCPFGGSIIPGVDIETTAADNGGGTFTHALIPHPSNPAINGNPNCGLTIDQRGLPRDTNCDIGAFELQATELPTATPTNTPSETPIPPTETPTTSLVASAECVGPDLEVAIAAGDGPFDILASSAPPGNTPYNNVPAGVYTSTGPGTWTNVRVIEQSSDFETANLGNFTCNVPTDTPVPPTDTSIPPTDTPVPPTDTLVPPTDTPVPPTDTSIPPTDTSIPPTDIPTSSLDATAVCNGPNLEVTIVSGDAPFIISASAGVNMPVAGVGLGTTVINGPEKWDNVTVTETSGEEIVNLGQFRCRSDERPVPLTPQHRSHTTDTTPTFSWTGITNANNYRVFIFDDPDPLGRTVDIRQNSGGPTMLTLSTPLPTKRLFWRVRGRQNRIWSLWSIRFTLFVDPVAPLSGQAPIPTIDLNPQREEPVSPNNR